MAVHKLPIDIFGLYQEEIVNIVAGLGLPKFRGHQIARWFYQNGVDDWQVMTNISLADRWLLTETFSYNPLKIVKQLASIDKATEKLLLAANDGQTFEMVIMRQPHGNSVCISTQVGCAMGCVFCASTIGGWIRDLSAGEIIRQVLLADNILRNQNEKLANVVVMGTGEPLANYDNLLRALNILHSDYSLGKSYRAFTISTAGVIPAIRRLMQENVPLNLAISLHASDDALRSQLMPINRSYPLMELLSAADGYAGATGRRVSYEYILLAGVNDSKEQAQSLAKLLTGRLAHVNLIPCNMVAESGFCASSSIQTQLFRNILSSFGLPVTVRRERGTDIAAACGQLRNKH